MQTRPMVLKPKSELECLTVGSPEQRRQCAAARGDLLYAIRAERQWRREAWAETRHVKTVQRLAREEAEAQREWDRPHRNFKVKREATWGEEKGVQIRGYVQHRAIATHSAGGALPRYSVALTDRAGRLFVFQRIRYYSARNTEQGRGAEAARYAIAGAHILPDGKRCISSNMGGRDDEIVAAMDVAEGVNRAVSIDAKTLLHGIMQSCHDLSPEQQFELVCEYAEYVFGRQQLPYLVVLHPPSAEGDQRNWHVHLLFSFRPMAKIGEGEWAVGKYLRTDLDTPEQFSRLRFLWAEALNHACEKAGVAKRFTHLSYAASGVDFIPQTHLGEGLTAMVRRGEHVALNAANHRLALRNSLVCATKEMRSALLATVGQTREAVERLRRSAAHANSIGEEGSQPRFRWISDRFFPSHPAAESGARATANDDGRSSPQPSLDHVSEPPSAVPEKPASVRRAANLSIKCDDGVPPFPPASVRSKSWLGSQVRAFDRLPSAPSSALESSASTATFWTDRSAPNLASRVDLRLGRLFRLPELLSFLPNAPGSSAPQASRLCIGEAGTSRPSAPASGSAPTVRRRIEPDGFLPGRIEPLPPRAQLSRLRDSGEQFGPPEALPRPSAAAPVWYIRADQREVPATDHELIGESRVEVRATSRDPAETEAARPAAPRHSPNETGSAPAARDRHGSEGKVGKAEASEGRGDQGAAQLRPKTREQSSREDGEFGQPIPWATGASKEKRGTHLPTGMDRLKQRPEHPILDSFSSGITAGTDKKEDDREARDSGGSNATTRAAAAAFWARRRLFEILEQERHLLTEDAERRVSVPAEVLDRAGLEVAQISSAGAQKQLAEYRIRNDAELKVMASHVAEKLHSTGGYWQLEQPRPAEVRALFRRWRDCAQVQAALRQMASLPPVGRDRSEVRDERCSTFLGLCVEDPGNRTSRVKTQQSLKSQDIVKPPSPYDGGIGG